MPEQTFLPVRDSKMQGAPDFAQGLNYGGALSLRHLVLYSGETKTTWERTIVDFDVSELAQVTIIAAKLVREISILSGGDGPEAKLARCTRAGEWVESKVTWLRYKAGADWTDSGGDFDDTGPPAALTYSEPTIIGEHEIGGLLAFVEDAFESRGAIVSLITRLADETPDVNTGATWFAKGHGQSWRLVVEYTAPNAGRRSIPRSTRRGSTTPRASSRPAHPHASVRPQQPTRRHR